LVERFQFLFGPFHIELGGAEEEVQVLEGVASVDLRIGDEPVAEILDLRQNPFGVTIGGGHLSFGTAAARPHGAPLAVTTVGELKQLFINKLRHALAK